MGVEDTAILCKSCDAGLVLLPESQFLPFFSFSFYSLDPAGTGAEPRVERPAANSMGQEQPGPDSELIPSTHA
jgi:hypothetical protein